MATFDCWVPPTKTIAPNSTGILPILSSAIFNLEAKIVFDSSEDAELAFYGAFSQGNAEAMRQVWALEEDIICIHPSGPKLVGPDLVHRSWKLILIPNQIRDFELRNCKISGDNDFRIHTLEEKIKIANPTFQSSVVYATNIYRKFQKGWLMVLHHASVTAETHLSSEIFEPISGKGPVIH